MKKETLSIRFLYQTAIGRGILKLLTKPFFSDTAGKFLDSRFSQWLVPLFIQKHGIDMNGFEGRKFCSFNDFFTRKRAPGQIDITPGHLISPCDGYLSVYPISQDQVYHIKHTKYHLQDLLKSQALAHKFSGGTCLIFRLTPQNYHRYCYVCDGTKMESKAIPGKLHCVRPTAYASFPVFTENSREYTRIRTQQFGDIIQMEIGALLVGKITNHPQKGTVFQGMEKGYFEFGGSTILLLIQKDRLTMDHRFLPYIKKGLEAEVRLGEKIGILKQKIDDRDMQNTTTARQ